ncbi:hypothetical protein HDA41_003008 [Streptomyces caelestis]|uniref:Uncharacterized protein n=1 Tax=Streptomyces caelestis TaxID=36816 RepID=A0A7W9LT17_9ACTN|nr:hypothetical protein [Streptomyces caelestis]
MASRFTVATSETVLSAARARWATFFMSATPGELVRCMRQLGSAEHAIPRSAVSAHQGDRRSVKIVWSRRTPVGRSPDGSPRMLHIGAGWRRRSRTR